MKTILFFFAATLLWVTGNAQRVIRLYDGTPPGNITRIDKEIFNRPATGRPTVKNVSLPTLTVFLPEKQNASGAAVIICPGGGYLNLSIEDGGYDVAKQLNAAGVTAFVLKYRTWYDSAFNNFRELPFMDLARATKIVYDSAAKWNLDTSRIGLLGLSAGGHLVSTTANDPHYKRPAFTGLIYPVISFMDSLTSSTSKTRATLIGTKASADEKFAYSPELHVTSGTPPAFIVHAEDDSTSMVNNSLVYYRALVAKKVAAQLTIYQKGGHGFALYNKVQDEYWMPSFIKWLALNGFTKKQ